VGIKLYEGQFKRRHILSTEPAAVYRAGCPTRTEGKRISCVRIPFISWVLLCLWQHRLSSSFSRFLLLP